ncbi:uncharacterized protein PFL1_00749 [Pseudozyma flocculosa PF-1]|uniref:Related to YRB2 - Ran-GTPase-binding protein involved in nuclear protein export n=1 Tax=Pseudozyma flocculosa TaxID=84751 RepID=A0A5C3F4E9_9BASI|nr:uncharacterized protein PFL1_00749 [Pseudozyma flocculosa PF-1]EPQ31414.1 hypothetical protein PFL1_00749 [Pseudozyma flocculosa PF-1]SPO38805.1 related to YRB2 - Ran-GTPase-binding protein involved in nuclear protein export [Pseudozyma flocculosa]
MSSASHKPATSSPAKDDVASPSKQTSSATAVAPFDTENGQAQHSSTADSPEPSGRTSLDKDGAEEHASRKRERETSLEPSANPSPSTAATPDSLPLKKNRLQNDNSASSRPEDVAEETEPAEESVEDKAKAAPETERVGQIRQKVQDLTWKEGKDGDAAKDSTAPGGKTTEAAEEASTAAAVPGSLSQEAKGAAKVETKSTSSPAETPAPVRTQPTFSSFSASASPFSSVPTPSGSSSTASGKGGFVSSASPFKTFAQGSASPFAKGGGIKPSSLGSSIGGHHETTTISAGSASTSGSSTPKGSNLGFGAFAGASPLKKTMPGPGAKEASPAAADQAPATSVASSKSFSEQLLSEADSATTETKSKDRPALDAAEQEVITGEEDEQSVHSVRAKLYTMADDQSWKERGTGTIRVNVPKSRDGKHSARLVMRADGILRLILNVSLFPGMKCELQEKFVRIVAFEDGNLAHFAIKMSNPTNAVAFMDAVQKQISKLSK